MNKIKLEEKGYTIEVTNEEKVTDEIRLINYVVKRGTRELTDGFIYVMSGDDVRRKLKDVLNSIVRAINRLQIT